jgi:hypothetical protein
VSSGDGDRSSIDAAKISAKLRGLERRLIALAKNRDQYARALPVLPC